MIRMRASLKIIIIIIIIIIGLRSVSASEDVIGDPKTEITLCYLLIKLR